MGLFIGSSFSGAPRVDITSDEETPLHPKGDDHGHRGTPYVVASEPNG
jgi:hypothetical protein